MLRSTYVVGPLVALVCDAILAVTNLSSPFNLLLALALLVTVYVINMAPAVRVYTWISAGAGAAMLVGTVVVAALYGLALRTFQALVLLTALMIAYTVLQWTIFHRLPRVL